MLNYIQIACAVLAIVFIFIGLSITVRTLKKNGSGKKADTDTIIKSTVLVVIGLLFYTGTKACSNMTVEGAEDYEFISIYIASFVQVIKVFGFIILVPAVINMMVPKESPKLEKKEEEADEAQ